MKPLFQQLARALGYSRVFHLDFETYSECPISNGIRAYATHPSTEVTLAAYAYGDDEPRLGDAGKPHEATQHRDAVRDACTDPNVLLIAWNTSFEREILEHVWGIKTPIEKWFDPAIVAHSMSLPGDLATASRILKLGSDEEKDKAGKKLIQIFCKPQPANRKVRRRDWNTDPELWAQFGRYCVRDVIAERKCLDRMSRFLPPEDEIRLWWVDQHINARGMPIDTDLVHAAQEVADELKADLKQECSILTGLENPNSRAQFLPWIQEHGYVSDSLKKDKVELAVRTGEVSETGKKALALRAQFSKNSTAKYPKIEAQTVDGQLCYTLQFAGAGRTWRWSGRGAQYQNLPRPPKELEDPAAMAQAVEVIKRRDPKLLRNLYAEPVNVLAGAIRPTLRARPGKILRVADYNAIENRGLGWLAQCESILDVFRNHRDPYKDFGAKMYGVDYGDITKKQRSNSKPAVLGAGYRLGGGREVLNKKTGEKTKTGLWGYSEALGVDLTKDESHLAVEVFRAEYPEVVEFWYALEKAAWATIQDKGAKVRRVPVGFSGQYLEFGYTKPAMYIRLPSGRCLWYIRPRIERCKMPWEDKDGKPVWKDGMTYEGLNQVTRQWQRVTTHGGKLTENVCQAVSRDILANGLMNTVEVGFSPVLHVHDETVNEEDIHGSNTVERLCAELCRMPDWARDMPMHAEGFESPFYMKD